MAGIDSCSFIGKKVLIRVDFNVPFDRDLNILDNTRIRRAIPTIRSVLKNGGTPILISHRGRPKNGFDPFFSMQPLALELEKLLNTPVVFLPDCVGKKVELSIKLLNPGSVVLLENLRFYKEEKMCDLGFSEKLSRLADVFINDAFGTAHRSHASTTGVTKFFPKTKYFGCIMEQEISSLNKIFKTPIQPLTAIIGGAKISSKIGVLSSLVGVVDNLIIGGGMAYTFIKALGGEIGDSLVEDNKIDLALSIISEAKKNNTSLCLPVDSLNSRSPNNATNIYFSDIKKINSGFMGVDIGEKSISHFVDIISRSGTVLWNGPMGVFEVPDFSKGTSSITQAIVSATEKGVFSLVGGGDSISALNQFADENKVSYVSAGGGAMLEYLEKMSLPAIDAIRS